MRPIGCGRSRASPIINKYSDSDVMNIEDHNLRRAILSRVCKNISHKYMNGINCIYLNYHRQGN